MNLDDATDRSRPAAQHPVEPTFGLAVVWPSGRAHDEQILAELGERFALADVSEVRWTPELTAIGYARFDGSSLVPPDPQRYLRERGVGAVLVISMFDEGATTERSQAGRSAGNRRFVEAAEALGLRFGRERLYVAGSSAEAARGLMLLLERSPAEVNRGPWSGTVQSTTRDLAGAPGWDGVRQMFAVLNTGAPYVVLRNFEGLAELDFLPGHTDIDILTADYVQTIALLGADSRLRVRPRWGGRFNVTIASRQVICDLRFPGDRYYESEWAGDILAGRQLHPGGFYVPGHSELVDTMLYHAVVHKPEVRQDYQTRLAEMAHRLGRSGWDADVLGDRSGAQSLLEEVLETRGFAIERPRDPTVYFNHRVRGVPMPIGWRLGDALKRRLYRVFLRNVAYPMRYAGLTLLDRLRGLRRR